MRIVTADTLTAAAALRRAPGGSRSNGNSNGKGKGEKNVAVLNMASPLRAGGGLLNGSTAQEELLCLRTTLYPSLRDEFYRLPELGVVWTPDVLVYRDGEGKEIPKADRWWVDVVSAGMLRFPEVDGEDAGARSASEEDSEDSDDEGNTGGAVYSNLGDRGIVEAKMTAVLRVLLAKGAERIVLGAWGCGAYKNPVGEIARAWRKVLMAEQEEQRGRRRPSSKGGNTKVSSPETWDTLEEVVFAIPEQRLAEQFAKAFGPDLEIEEDAEDLEVDVADAELEASKEELELETKIAELEGQMQKVMNPGLKNRLGNVLQGLNNRLDQRTNTNGGPARATKVETQMVKPEPQMAKTATQTAKATTQMAKAATQKPIAGKSASKNGRLGGSDDLFKGDHFFADDAFVNEDPFFDDNFFDKGFFTSNDQKKTKR